VIVSLVVFGAAPAYGQEKTEMFLFSMPPGFKLGWQKDHWAEWVPVAKTVESWSEMITIQT